MPLHRAASDVEAKVIQLCDGVLRGSAIVSPLRLEDVLSGHRVALVVNPLAVAAAREADAQQQLFGSLAVEIIGIQLGLVLVGQPQINQAIGYPSHVMHGLGAQALGEEGALFAVNDHGHRLAHLWPAEGILGVVDIHGRTIEVGRAQDAQPGVLHGLVSRGREAVRRVAHLAVQHERGDGFSLAVPDLDLPELDRLREDAVRLPVQRHEAVAHVAQRIDERAAGDDLLRTELADFGLKSLPRLAVYGLATLIQVHGLLSEIAIGLHAADAIPQDEVPGIQRRIGQREADGVVVNLLNFADVVEVGPLHDAPNRKGAHHIVGGDGAAVAPQGVLAQVHHERLVAFELPALGQPGFIVGFRGQIVGHRQLDPAVVQAETGTDGWSAGGKAVEVPVRRNRIRPGGIEGPYRGPLPQHWRDAGEHQRQHDQNNSNTSHFLPPLSYILNFRFRRGATAPSSHYASLGPPCQLMQPSCHTARRIGTGSRPAGVKRPNSASTPACREDVPSPQVHRIASAPSSTSTS